MAASEEFPGAVFLCRISFIGIYWLLSVSICSFLTIARDRTVSHSILISLSVSRYISSAKINGFPGTTMNCFTPKAFDEQQFTYQYYGGIILGSWVLEGDSMTLHVREIFLGFLRGGSTQTWESKQSGAINTLAPGRFNYDQKLLIFGTHIKDRYFEHFLWNYPEANATRPHSQLVNIGSGNDSVPSSCSCNKPLPVLIHM